VDHIKDNLLAWGMLESLQQKDVGPLCRIQLYHYKSMLKESTGSVNAAKGQSGYSVESKYRRMQRKFRSKILESAEIYARWWDLLQESSPAFPIFAELGITLLNCVEFVKKLWNRIKHSAVIPKDAFSLYVLFCENLEADPEKARRLRQKYGNENVKAIRDDFTMAGYSENGECIVSVSAKKDTVGDVIGCNKAFSQVTGYVTTELLGKKLTKVIPSVYQKAHDEAFKRCSAMIEYGEKCESWSKSTYIQMKSGYIVPVKIRVIDFPHFANNSVFIAAISVPKKERMYRTAHFLLDPEKFIVAMSSSIPF
jgi:PAS domain S-box-containing protein